MNQNIPNDPMMLLSFVNTKLRDVYGNLEAFCDDLGLEKEMLLKKLNEIDYEYDEHLNRFV